MGLASSCKLTRFCLPTRMHRAPQVFVMDDVALNYYPEFPGVFALSFGSKARNMPGMIFLLYFPQYACANCPKCHRPASFKCSFSTCVCPLPFQISTD